MQNAGFVHLRVHSSYSLSEGAIKAGKIAELARKNGMPAVAIADTANLFGALEFSQACTASGVQPIIGCQLALARPGAKDGDALADPVVLLAQTAEGLANLQRLSSLGFMTSDPANPFLTSDVMCQHAAGLFLMLGGTGGPIARLLVDNRMDDARHLAAALAEAFPGRVAMELHRHGLPIEAAIEPGMIALADELRLPLVATNECFFPDAKLHAAHDALLCIAGGRQVAEAERRRVTPEHWFKPEAAMRAAFADLPDACDNTLAIARTCAVMAETRKPMLPTSRKAQDRSEEQVVRELAVAGLARRMEQIGAEGDRRREYETRLAYELDVIATMGFPGYFLIVADFIQWAKGQGIPVGPGRGSGAGSVVAWALTITDLDPLRWGLLFERFLNPERVSMPDFDIDFCQDRRDEVIGYVRNEYGADRVAQIITFGKLQARAAVRDVGRVLGLPFGQVNRVAELIPNNPAHPVTLQQAIDGEPKLQAMRADDEAVRHLLEVALQLEGLYRHASTHAAGVVIGDRPLIDLVPLYRDPRADTLVTQYSMKYVEQAGLVKFDFLGLTTLTILQRAVALLRQEGVRLDLDSLPLDDVKTYEMLARGDAGGVFQFESPGMRDVLKQMRPDRFEDLIAAVSLYRPGPMANIPDYCRRKHGEAWAPPHPMLQDLLGETYGIMVYQEQVMQIAQTMAGYSLGDADLLRRAMGKKIRSEMDAQRSRFQEGAVARGIDPAKAAEVFDLIAKFAEYGFNKSHAAAYALVSYQTAWMKANHPAAFLAACMSLAIGNTDKLAALCGEATRCGIAVLPPDVNRSGADFTLERHEGKAAIRYALAAVKKVGAAAMKALVATRGAASFEDMADFAGRIDPKVVSKTQLENLARAGAFDGIDRNRARMAAAADQVMKRAQAKQEEAASGQRGMFAVLGGGNRPEPLPLPDLVDWPDMDRLGFEAEAIGFHMTAHPLDSYASLLRRLGAVHSAQLETIGMSGVGRAKVAGCVVSVKERTTRTGSRMAWVRLSDKGGSFEVTLFSEVLGGARPLLAPGTPVVVTVDLRLEGDALRVTAAEFTGLEQAAQAAGANMRIWLDRTEAVPHIRAVLDREKQVSGARGPLAQARGRVSLLPRVDAAQEVEIALPGMFNVTPRLAQALKAIPGVERVEEV